MAEHTPKGYTKKDEAKILAKKNKDAKSRGENLPPLKEAINE